MKLAVPTVKLPTTRPEPINVASVSSTLVVGPALAKGMLRTLYEPSAHVAHQMCQKSNGNQNRGSWGGGTAALSPDKARPEGLRL